MGLQLPCWGGGEGGRSVVVRRKKDGAVVAELKYLKKVVNHRQESV